MRIRTLVTALAAAALAVSTAACGTEATEDTAVDSSIEFEAGTTMARLNEAQRISIGTKFDQPLFGLKGLDGKPAGFDVEIAKLIAGKLGLSPDKIDWVETPSKVREEAIEQGKADLVVATYTITDKRKQRIDFAGPYYIAGQDLMVKAGDTSITGPESFKDGEKKVCSVTGSTPAEQIAEFLQDEGRQLVLFDVYSKCADALKNGLVDAVTTDNVILLGLIEQSGGAFQLVNKPFTQEPYGIGLKKNDEKFRAFINAVLEESAKDGVYAKAWKETAGRIARDTPSLPAIDRY